MLGEDKDLELPIWIMLVIGICGIGFAYSIGDRKIEIDYSYSNAEYFDAVNRFALTVGF